MYHSKIHYVFAYIILSVLPIATEDEPVLTGAADQKFIDTNLSYNSKGKRFS